MIIVTKFPSLGRRVIGPELAKAHIPAFLNAEYQGTKAGAEKASRQIARFISYLETHPQSRKLREDAAEYEV